MLKPATDAALDESQREFLLKLHGAVEEVNLVDGLLKQNNQELQAIAHLLSVIAKMQIIEAANKYNMANRLLAFK